MKREVYRWNPTIVHLNVMFPLNLILIILIVSLQTVQRRQKLIWEINVTKLNFILNLSYEIFWYYHKLIMFNMRKHIAVIGGCQPKDMNFIIIIWMLLWLVHVPLSSYAGNLIPRETVLRGGTFESWLGYEDPAFMNELMCLIREWVILCESGFVIQENKAPLSVSLSSSFSFPSSAIHVMTQHEGPHQMWAPQSWNSQSSKP